MRPLLLDLFCGAGGAAVGYHRAGFDVIGVDLNPQPHYPYQWVQADALKVLTAMIENGLSAFSAIHASPPCQAYTTTAGSRKRSDHPDLINPVRELLEMTGLPWVIENVPGALYKMREPIVLCGATFGLPVIRHRLFETNWGLRGHDPQCPVQTKFGSAVFHGPQYVAYARGTWEPRWRREVLPVVWPWMTVAESGQAIPPAYTEYVGQQLLMQIQSKA